MEKNEFGFAFRRAQFYLGADEPMKLSRAALAALEDENNRLLVAQSIVEDFTIVPADSEFPDYPAKLLW